MIFPFFKNTNKEQTERDLRQTLQVTFSASNIQHRGFRIETAIDRCKYLETKHLGYVIQR